MRGGRCDVVLCCVTQLSETSPVWYGVPPAVGEGFPPSQRKGRGVSARQPPRSERQLSREQRGRGIITGTFVSSESRCLGFICILKIIEKWAGIKLMSGG